MRVLFLESHPMWIHGLPNGFRDAGHEVVVSGPLTETILRRLMLGFRPNLVISMGWTEEHSVCKQRWIGKHVRSVGVPYVYWATEDPGFTTSFSLPFVYNTRPQFVFTTCLPRVAYYRELGIEAAHLDFGYHPSMHHPTERRNTDPKKIAVVANAYPWVMREHPDHIRAQCINTLIRPLLAHGYRIDFYGRDWDEMLVDLGVDVPPAWCHGLLPYTQTNEIYNESSVVIGLLNQPTQLTQRVYEILGSGGFLLTYDTPEVRRLFAPGRDLMVTTSPEETLTSVEHFLNHPAERDLIRAAGYDAVRQHTYQHRARQIIRVLSEAGVFRGHHSRYERDRIEQALKPAVDGTYVVRDGDTFLSIGFAFHVSDARLKELNGLNDESLQTGQCLKIFEPDPQVADSGRNG